VGQGGQALIEPLLGQVELVWAAPPRTFGMGPTDGKVERDDELAIAHDPEEQDAIDAVHGVFEWAAPPSADESE